MITIGIQTALEKADIFFNAVGASSGLFCGNPRIVSKYRSEIR